MTGQLLDRGSLGNQVQALPNNPFISNKFAEDLPNIPCFVVS